MTLPKGNNGGYPMAEYGSTGKVYVYDIKMEISIEKGVDSVAVPSIFRDLMKHMTEAANHALIFRDATQEIVSADQPPDGTTFQERFRVETVTGKNRKVVMGFGLETKTAISTLKYRMMDYLSSHKVFLRVHTGGFEYGVRTAFLGFIVDENPDTADIALIESDLAESLQHYWMNSTHLTADSRNKLIGTHGAFLSEGNNILPFHVEKNKISATNSHGKKVDAKGLIVTTPVQFAEVLKNMLDGIVVVDKSLNNFIPADLRKEEPDTFYNITVKQAKFISNHRNIPLNGVEYDLFYEDIQNTGTPFAQLLEGRQDIHRVYYDDARKKVNISTTISTYLATKAWLDSEITARSLPFQTKTFSFDGSIKSGRSGTSKYANIFSNSVASDASFDQSTIKTRDSNVWMSRRPIIVDYALSDIAFPPLRDKPAVVLPTSRTAPIAIDDSSTIQDSIDIALKQAETKYQTKLQELTDQMETRLQKIEQSMATMVSQIVEQTYQSFQSTNSPFASKEDHLILQTEVSSISSKLDTLLQLFNTGGPESPPRAKRQNTAASPARLHLSNAPVSQDTPMGTVREE
jgi:hypothetical protein